jgi:sensor histidine kinase YesM
MEKLVEPEIPKVADGPKKNGHPVLWVLGGCLMFLVVCMLIIGGLVFWGYRKAKREIREHGPNVEQLEQKAKEFQEKSGEFEVEMQKVQEQIEKNKIQTGN